MSSNISRVESSFVSRGKRDLTVIDVPKCPLFEWLFVRFDRALLNMSKISLKIRYIRH